MRRMNKKEPTVRERVGQERRERTRQALVDAAIKVIAEKGAERATIDDFVAAAGISRGTFYNHFPDADELITAVARRLSSPIHDEIGPNMPVLSDPAVRMAFAIKTFMQRAIDDPTWGWVVSKLSAVTGSVAQRIDQQFLADLDDGMARGRFKTIDRKAALDVVSATGLNAMRTLLTSKQPDRYMHDIILLIMRALGVDDKDAREIAAQPLPQSLRDVAKGNASVPAQSPKRKR